MKHKNIWYSLILGILFSFCFGTSVFAATSQVSTTFQDTAGNTISIRGQQYTNQTYDEQFEAYITQGNQQILTQCYKWNLTENISFTDLDANKFYSGYFYFRITVSPSNNETQISNWRMAGTEVQDGVHMYIGAVSSNYVQVGVLFDNWDPQRSLNGLPTIMFDAVLNDTDNVMSATQNFTVTLSNVQASFRANSIVENNALTAMLFSAISQGVGPQLDTVMSLLTDIRNQDYTYYVQLTNGISQILINQANSYQALLDIIDELDTDFEDVQTVLDLFPSYRLQVLQYWQEFLEMNAAQSSEAAEQESKYADGESQASNMVSNMEAVGLPSISSGDLDILGTIDGTQKNNFFGVIALITHTEIVTKIMLIIVIGAMVGFIMYGKKGG